MCCSSQEANQMLKDLLFATINIDNTLKESKEEEEKEKNCDSLCNHLCQLAVMMVDGQLSKKEKEKIKEMLKIHREKLLHWINTP